MPGCCPCPGTFAARPLYLIRNTSGAMMAFFPVCVSLFLLSGVVNENIKGQFEDENAKFRPVPPVPDTGC